MAIHFLSPFNQAECVRRVEAITDQWWLAPGLDPVIGKVRDDRFHWYIRPSSQNGTIGPRLHVQFRPQAGGTWLACRFRPFYPGLVAPVLVLAFWILMIRHGVPASAAAVAFPLDRAEILMVSMAIWTVIAGLIYLYWRNKRAELIDLLQKTLDAKAFAPPAA